MESKTPSDYVSRQPWVNERPHTLLVCCSDGRYRPHLEDFINQRVAERPDIVALPGGPAGIDACASSFDHASVVGESLDLLFASHDLRELWLVAHEGCSWYRHQHPSLEPAKLRERQFADLRRAREIVRERHPAAAVNLVYARVDGTRVLFQDLEAS